MIGIIFNYGNEVVEVRIDGMKCFFRTSQFHKFATLEGLKLDKKGVIKEFPDLKDNENWRDESIKRFENKMEKLDNENERMRYIIKDLSKFGYKPMYYQKQGYRPVKLSK